MHNGSQSWNSLKIALIGLKKTIQRFVFQNKLNCEIPSSSSVLLFYAVIIIHFCFDWRFRSV